MAPSEQQPASVQPDRPESAGAGALASQFLGAIGGPLIRILIYVGGVALMGVRTIAWCWRGLVLRRIRFGRPAFYSQIVRLGVRAVGIIALVSSCIGVILALQMAPTLDEFGQVEKVANVIAVAVVRELGPLLTAVVLTGFAGASIAAELGTMVVGEEIEALQAHGLNPTRFLVLPRILATTLCILALCVFGELVALTSGWFLGVFFLDIPSRVYIDNTIAQLDVADVLTGLCKAGVFGSILGGIACYNGLSVTGGAAGVGRATTYTVVHAIVAIVATDLIFTVVFYKLAWN